MIAELVIQALPKQRHQRCKPNDESNTEAYDEHP
jgi:hypothetical protein